MCKILFFSTRQIPEKEEAKIYEIYDDDGVEAEPTSNSKDLINLGLATVNTI